jgi:protein TonB
MAGAAGQAVLLAAAVIIPLAFPEALPRTRLLETLLLPLAAPPPPPPPGAGIRNTPRTPARTFQFRGEHLWAPERIPARVAMIEEPPMSAAEAPATGGVPGGSANGIEGGIPGALTAHVARPQPLPHSPPPAPSAPASRPEAREVIRIRQGGLVQAALLIHQVMPAYPALAVQARISGTVQLEGVIATDGRITELRLLGGHPLLVHAAMEAVKQWRYRPTMLNGEPVEVLAPITVHFRLD